MMNFHRCSSFSSSVLFIPPSSVPLLCPLCMTLMPHIVLADANNKAKETKRAGIFSLPLSVRVRACPSCTQEQWGLCAGFWVTGRSVAQAREHLPIFGAPFLGIWCKFCVRWIYWARVLALVLWTFPWDWGAPGRGGQGWLGQTPVGPC